MQGISHINHGFRCLSAQCFKTASSQYHFGRKISKHFFLNNERKNPYLSKSSWHDSADSHLKKINERKSDNRDNKSGGACSSADTTGHSLHKCILASEKTEKDTQPDPLKITVKVVPMTGEGAGSGFYFDEKGHVITAAHVVSNNTLFYCKSLSGRGIYTVGAKDDKLDIAVLNPAYKTKLPGSLESSGYQISKPDISFMKPTNLSAFDYYTGKFITLRQRGVINIPDYVALNFLVDRSKPGYSGGLITSEGYFEGMILSQRQLDIVLCNILKLNLTIGEVYLPARTVDYCARSLIEHGKVVHYDLGIALKEEKKELKVISCENKKILTNDKVLALNGKEVASVRDFAQALPEIESLVTGSSKKELALLLERDGIVQTVSLPISESEKNYHNSFKHGCF